MKDTGTDGGDSLVSRWSPMPQCVGPARAELRKALAGWGMSGIEDAALLVLSELLTNAVVHGRVAGREIETRCFPARSGLRIEVHDTADGCPRLTVPEAEAPGGRGLPLVEALADRWGVAGRQGPGKAVWAELSVEGGGHRP
ncbi:ATP-binding protein [Streptomyces jumonjinensis]|uniref:ATP-binding protein n=1 Tax=Streptomyces jumonjinensis TaxID=1945 RepID=UPI0037900B5D